MGVTGLGRIAALRNREIQACFGRWHGLSTRNANLTDLNSSIQNLRSRPPEVRTRSLEIVETSLGGIAFSTYMPNMGTGVESSRVSPQC